MTPNQKPRGSATSPAAAKQAGGFTAEERAAMKERAREAKSASRRRGSASAADGEAEVMAKIAGMEGSDRVMAERVHAIVRATAPELTPRTWYGMPAYAKNGSVVCFFQDAKKFKSRYATLGFSDKARLDDGAMWPVAFALTEITAVTESAIAELVKRAVS